MAVFQESQGYCSECDRRTLVRGQSVNHTFHAVMTLLCCGWWLWIWAIQCLLPIHWRCTRCGRDVSAKSAGLPTSAFKVLGFVLLGLGVLFAVAFVSFTVMAVLANLAGVPTTPTTSGAITIRPTDLAAPTDAKPTDTGTETRPTTITAPTRPMPTTPATVARATDKKPDTPPTTPAVNVVTLTPPKDGTIYLGSAQYTVATAVKEPEVRANWLKGGQLKAVTLRTDVELIARDKDYSRVKLDGKEWVVESKWLPAPK